MKGWNSQDAYWTESDDGQRRISKTTARVGTKSVLQYQLWHKGDGKWIPKGLFDTAQDAADWRAE
ncbi:unnamed protein product [marine sediment metagenome]|uniref:Uncharacterized protein n=1 Tax=marine sediment metagenome TaxID=412755 RepID=X0TL09_9ZZZZ